MELFYQQEVSWIFGVERYGIQFLQLLKNFWILSRTKIFKRNLSTDLALDGSSYFFFLLFKFSSFNRFSIISKINYYGKSVRNQRSHNQKPPIDMWISLKKKFNCAFQIDIFDKSDWTIYVLYQFQILLDFFVVFFCWKKQFEKEKDQFSVICNYNWHFGEKESITFVWFCFCCCSKRYVCTAS